MACADMLWQVNHKCVEPNSFINDLPLPCRRIKKSFGQVIRMQPVDSLKMFQQTSDDNCYPIRQ